MQRSLMIDHAAALLGVSRRTVYYRIRQGRLRTLHTPGGTQRVLLDSLQALMRAEAAPFRNRGGGLGPAFTPERSSQSVRI